ncbi:MAG: hypothetical protein CL677_03015 [Bdellovibrionaceae bacterium]|nr:hypothetical protein [Pseudobdellovibrionaceae bacterium]|tara:strand:- start:96033 stop:97250 length:1218 start_codon:yes stop_codon:yes gene_type:complete
MKYLNLKNTFRNSLLWFVLLSSLWVSAVELDQPFKQMQKTFLDQAREVVSRNKSAQLYLKEIVPEESLMMSVLYMPPEIESKNLVILSAGTHGAEGPLGSAALTLFLQEYGEKVDRSRTGFLLFHGVNPYGFDSGRRVDQENRDLNRNFVVTSDELEIENSAYSKIEAILNPKHKVKSIGWSYFKMLGQVFYQLTFGGMSINEFRQASVGGQYKYPKGIYYGGAEVSPSVVHFKEIILQHVKDYENILHMDFHTGLGESGQLHLILAAQLNTFERDKMSEVFDRTDGKFYEINTGESEGFYEVTGDITDFIRKLQGDSGQNIYGVTAEFGTKGLGILNQLESLHAIIQENQGHHYGYANEGLETKVKRTFRELFNPSDPGWQKRVTENTRHLFGVSLPRWIELHK